MTKVDLSSPMRRSVREVADVLLGTVPANTVEAHGGSAFFGLAEITADGRGPLRFVNDVGTRPVRLAVGDVVIARLGSVGASTIVRERHVGAVLGRECLAIRSTTDQVAGSWLHIWALSTDFKNQAERHTSGVTMPRLDPRALRDFELPLPAREHQVRVGAMLERFDVAIDLTGTVLRELTELREVEVDLAFADLLADAKSSPPDNSDEEHN